MNTPNVEELVSGLSSWLARFGSRLRQAVVAVAALAALAGLVAVGLGLAAWHSSTAIVVLVVVLLAPALVVPAWLAWRVRPLTKAVSQPDELVRQARSYVSSLSAGPQVNALIKQVSEVASHGDRRLRGVWKSSKLVRQLVEVAKPDPTAQPLVAAFTPERLRGLWAGLITAWWLWLISLGVSVVAGLTLVARAIT